jgi:hypothetical protein
MNNQKHLNPFHAGKELEKLLEGVQESKANLKNKMPIYFGISPEIFTKPLIIKGKPDKGKSSLNPNFLIRLNKIYEEVIYATKKSSKRR